MAKRAFLNTFLNSPIIRNRRDEFYLDMMQYSSDRGSRRTFKPSDRHVMKKFLEASGDREIECLNPEEYYTVDSMVSQTGDCSLIQESLGVVEKIVRKGNNGLARFGIPQRAEIQIEGLRQGALDHQVWFWRHMSFRRIIDQIACKESKGIKALARVEGDNHILVGNQNVVLLIPAGHPISYLMSYEQALMFKDMYHARYNSLVTASHIYPDTDLPTRLEEVFNWFSECLVRHGNRGFSVGKEVEALANSYLVEFSDPFLGEGFTHGKMLQVIRDKELELGTLDNFLADKLDRILRRCETVQQVVELFGTQKLFGHPLIDPSYGGEKVRDEARTPKHYNYENIQRLRNNFCRLYCEGYIRVNKEWPGLVFPNDGIHRRLQELHGLNEIRPNSEGYPLADWSGVTFVKHHEFDYFPNYLDLMDDRAISLYRSNLSATWNKNVKPKSHKRLLLEMLTKEGFSILKIVEAVRREEIPFDWLVVSLYPKEREFKEAARMFGMLVFEMRAFFTATEANLAEKIFPLIPQQTMTLSKIEIQELFHATTAETLAEDWERLFNTYDVNKWNLHWDPRTVDPIGHTIEDMFGLPGVFTVIHHFFAKCVMVVRTAECAPPSIELAEMEGVDAAEYESSLMWFNHDVGIEGLFQKGWTLCTYPMIDLGIRPFGCKYYLIGQGDNQVLMIYVNCFGAMDKREYLREISDAITEAISQECMKVGQSIKKDETLSSTTVITYSKNVYVRGVEYFTTCKNFSRMFPHASSDFPSLDNSVGALASQATMAAEGLKQPLLGYPLFLFHASLYLLSIKCSQPVEASLLPSRVKRQITPIMVYCLLILPKSLGGLQIAVITDFFYKGGADPVSKEYASFLFLQDKSPIIRRCIYSLKQWDWFSKEPAITELIDDPYALPLRKHTTPEMSIFRESSRKVRGVTKNPDIQSIMSLDIEQYETELASVLITMTPFNPLIASDIMGWSIAGLRKMIGKMFTATRTVQDLMQRDEEFNPCWTILTQGTAVFREVIHRFLHLPNLEGRISSVYEDICALRRAWDPMDRYQIVGVTAYTPFEVPIIVQNTPIPNQGIRAALLDTIGKEASFKRGLHPPYLGKRTQEKRSEHGYRIVISSAPERAVKRLTDVMVQPGVDITVREMINQVALTRAGVDLCRTIPYLGRVYGGTIVHRYQTRLGVRSAHGMGSMCLASNTILSSNNAAPLSGGEEDYPRMVQEDMVMCISLLQHCSQYINTRLYVVVPYDLAPMEVLPVQTMFCDLTKIPKPMTLRDNHLVYQEDIYLEVTKGIITSAMCTPIACDERSGFLVVHALRRLMIRSLDRGHSSLAISDQAGGQLLVRLGLPELRGCSLQGVASAAALAIASVSTSMAFTRSGSQVRWSALPSIMSMSTSFARTLSPLCGSPLMQDDPLNHRIQGSSPMSYTGAYLSVVRRLANVISREAIELVVHPESTLYTGPIILFSDEPVGSTSRAVIRVLHQSLLCEVIRGTIPPAMAYRIARVHIPSAVRREPEEAGKLNALYRLLHRLQEWAVEQNLPDFMDRVSAVIRGRALYQVNIPATESLRLSRVLQSVVASLIPSCRELLVAPINPMPQCIYEETPGGLPALQSPIWSAPHSKYDYDCFTAHRLQGRIHGGMSSVGYSYLPLVTLFSGRFCVMIGCGHGAGAGVMIHSGAIRVWGLDLGVDLARRNNLDVLPYPTCVLPLKERFRFERLLGGPVADGDIYDPETTLIIREQCVPGSLVVVDIPLNSPESIKKLLIQLQTIWEMCEVLIRFIGTTGQVADLYATLGNSIQRVQGINVYSGVGYTECWFHMILTPKIDLRAVSVDTNTIPTYTNPVLGDCSFLGGGPHFLYDLIFGLYQDTRMGDQQITTRLIMELASAAVGPLDHRFTYDQWTQLLTAILANYITHQPRPIVALCEVLREDVLEIIHEGWGVTIAMTAERNRILSRVYSRLL